MKGKICQNGKTIKITPLHMLEGYEGLDSEHDSDLTENDNVTLEDALVAIAENTVDITQLQKDYANLLKKIINIQSGIASI
ncbi:MAG: hypothetical protein PHU93_04270 [Candidatus Gracilibacteria bacterium]|nr:hypothetical protein [Candidatus Gracilibacteria bacterium]